MPCATRASYNRTVSFVYVGGYVFGDGGAGSRTCTAERYHEHEMSLVDDDLGCILPCATHRTIFISSSTISLVVWYLVRIMLATLRGAVLHVAFSCMLLPLWLWLLPEQLFGDGPHSTPYSRGSRPLLPHSHTDTCPLGETGPQWTLLYNEATFSRPLTSPSTESRDSTAWSHNRPYQPCPRSVSA